MASESGRSDMASDVTCIIDYVPTAKQLMLHTSRANEILWGGGAGGGKSLALLMEAVNLCLHIPKLQVYLFRDTFPDLDRNHIIPFRSRVPEQLYAWNESKHRATFRPTGAMLNFCSCQYERDVFSYQGVPELHVLIIDELTHFTKFTYDYLKGRLRCATPIPKQWQHRVPSILCASNPGGVGHNFAKERWIDAAAPMVIHQEKDPLPGVPPMKLQFIPSLVSDNPHIDAGYIGRLDKLPEPYRSAYLNGDWNVFFGQFFRWDYAAHVCENMPIPKDGPLYFTFDWGFGAPFSIGYWWQDNDGRLYRFNEIYGYDADNQSLGVRKSDDEIAEQILKFEKDIGIANRNIIRLGSHDCWNRKPNLSGGGQLPSTSEVFADYGILMIKADPDRQSKVRQFHMRLRKPEDGSRPMLQVYRRCAHFARCVPTLQTDKHNVEYWDETKNPEDHNIDDACQIFMHLPMDTRGFSENNRATRLDRSIEQILTRARY